jgi:hypothetical protein
MMNYWNKINVKYLVQLRKTASNNYKMLEHIYKKEINRIQDLVWINILQERREDIIGDKISGLFDNF